MHPNQQPQLNHPESLGRMLRGTAVTAVDDAQSTQSSEAGSSSLTIRGAKMSAAEVYAKVCCCCLCCYYWWWRSQRVCVSWLISAHSQKKAHLPPGAWHLYGPRSETIYGTTTVGCMELTLPIPDGRRPVWSTDY